jgi:hypothetical protein
MGLRGAHANARSKHQQPPDEPVITPQAVALFRRMTRLEKHCECPPYEELLKFDDWQEHQCQNCRECWRLNTKLCSLFGLPAWEFAYWNPLDNAPPDASGVQRFYQLEAAASKTKEQRFKFKWEK